MNTHTTNQLQTALETIKHARKIMGCLYAASNSDTGYIFATLRIDLDNAIKEIETEIAFHKQ